MDGGLLGGIPLNGPTLIRLAMVLVLAIAVRHLILRFGTKAIESRRAKSRAPTAAVKFEEVEALHGQGVGASRAPSTSGLAGAPFTASGSGKRRNPAAVKSWHNLSRAVAPGSQP